MAVIEQLCAEMGGERADVPSRWLRGETAGYCRFLEGSEREGPAILRRSLARLAAAARHRSARPLDPPGERAVQAALDGAELLMYSEMVTGRSAMLPTHLPSFAFMAVLPSLGRRRALQVAERAAELLDSAA